uniref:YaiI/YqxD family protein n=1 Tax=Ningiella ruwaisensis TaxID=2364274 RepID=UPI00109F86E2|nr:YaiI/YqxD family protein [Ningiella ruwaisensis]
MKIIVDADACPKVIKEVICKAANRTQVHALFIANHYIPLPNSPYLTGVQVQSGFDVADHEVVSRSEAGDLVITSDIPLAAEVIEKGAHALSSRGELFDKQTIKARLNTRDFMETMRASGFQSSGPPPLSQRDRKAFADNLDRILAKR